MSHTATIKFEAFKDLELAKKAFEKLGWKTADSKAVRLYSTSAEVDLVMKNPNGQWDIGLKKNERGEIEMIHDTMIDTRALDDKTGQFGKLKQMYAVFEQKQFHEQEGMTVTLREFEENNQLQVELICER